MPIHDWTRLETGDFHHFHQSWITYIADALNGGGLPPGYMALSERVTGGSASSQLSQVYANRKDRVSIRNGRGRVVAIIELVSPGNKSSRQAIRSFVEKAADILTQGIHLVIVDLFPQTPRDPQGIHKAIWDEFGDMPFDFLPDKPLTVASYIGGDSPTAYVESVGIGDLIPSIPLFLTEYDHIPCPLEATYMQAWAVFPAMLRELMDSPQGLASPAFN